MSFRVGVIGVNRVNAMMQEWGEEIQEGMRQQVQRAARNILQHARREVPVRTGALQRSLKITSESGGDRVFVGSDLHYAVFVEEGTSRMTAQPFLVPALEAERPRLLRRVNRMIAKASEKFNRQV